MPRAGVQCAALIVSQVEGAGRLAIANVSKAWPSIVISSICIAVASDCGWRNMVKGGGASEADAATTVGRLVEFFATIQPIRAPESGRHSERRDLSSK
jgi:hypothetical protein